MKKDMLVITKMNVSLEIPIETVGKETIKVTSHCEAAVRTTGQEKPVTLNCVPHVPEVEHSLISVLNLCDNNHTVGFTNEICVVMMETA